MQNVTPIEMLPELEDLERRGPNTEQIGRYIRNNNAMHRESGMTETPPEQTLKMFNMPANTPSCLDVAEHIANCPICSRFYNNDKTIYIIAIIVLSVLCILLLKKVLEV